MENHKRLQKVLKESIPSFSTMLKQTRVFEDDHIVSMTISVLEVQKLIEHQNPKISNRNALRSVGAAFVGCWPKNVFGCNYREKLFGLYVETVRNEVSSDL